MAHLTRQEQEKRYAEAPTKEYNDCPLYSWRSEEWYTDIDDYWERTDDEVSEDPDLKEEWDATKTTAKGVCDYGLLYMSKPNYLPTLEFDDCIELPDNCDDLSDILKTDHPIALKLAELNQLIEDTKFIVSYSECKSKPDPETLGFKY